MKNKDIKNQIRRFSEIVPNEKFSEKSKMEIFSTEREIKPIVTRESKVWISNILEKYARTISLATATALVFVLVYYAITQISPVFLPGLDQNKILAEADEINNQINLEVKKIEYFNKLSQETENALTEVKKNKLDYLNENIIKNETKQVESIDSNSSMEEINAEVNNVLEEISK